MLCRTLDERSGYQAVPFFTFSETLSVLILAILFCTHMTCGSINPVGLPDEPQRHPNHPYPSHEPTIPVSLGVGIFLPSPDADPGFESPVTSRIVQLTRQAHLNENPVLIWVPNRNRPNSQPSPVQAPPTHPRSRSAPNPPSALKIAVLLSNSERFIRPI